MPGCRHPSYENSFIDTGVWNFMNWNRWNRHAYTLQIWKVQGSLTWWIWDGLSLPFWKKSLVAMHQPSPLQTLLSNPSLPPSFTNSHMPRKFFKERSSCAPVIRNALENSAFRKSGICLFFENNVHLNNSCIWISLAHIYSRWINRNIYHEGSKVQSGI